MKRAIDLTGKLSGVVRETPEARRPQQWSGQTAWQTMQPTFAAQAIVVEDEPELFGYVDIPRLLEIENERHAVMQVVCNCKDITARFVEGNDVEGWWRENAPGVNHGTLRFYARGRQGIVE